MRVYKDVEEIKDFQLNDGQVPYHYKDEISLIYLVTEIINKSN